MAAAGTIKQREQLIPDSRVALSGFKHRSSQRLATKRMPRTMLNIECNHLTRCAVEDATHGFPSLEYQLWLEAGKYATPYPERPDKQYNSNIWRNFRKDFGFNPTTKERNATEVIATMYPINIPAPSKVGKNSYSKFLHETKFIEDDKQRDLAIRRTTCDEHEFKQIRAKSYARNPPLDENGEILPPSNFTRYQQRLVSSAGPRLLPVSPHQFDAYRDNLFEYRRSLIRTPQLKKLSFKENNPEYTRVLKDLKEKERTLPMHPPALITHPSTQTIS